MNEEENNLTRRKTDQSESAQKTNDGLTELVRDNPEQSSNWIRGLVLENHQLLRALAYAHKDAGFNYCGHAMGWFNKL